ncbi:MFS transporter [Sulfobacillus thermosulfidooxidans]|uniref:MFS transporter n=1 Tax=Sulfobacillus thermosulfidooxidans TaxID=28034 RepID=UPI0012FDCDE1|nr:MFS transporter [Sulfobacillus thermosulfidooxidans]
MTYHLSTDRDFQKLWVGQGISLFGSLTTRLVLPFFIIYTLSATPMQVAWIRIAEIVPGMMVGLFAGVAADRWPRRQIMGMVDVVRAGLVGLIPTLFFWHCLTLGILIGLVVMLSLAQMLFDSAYDAYLPTLVPADQLITANAKLSAMGSVAEVTGFGLAGFMFAWLGGPLVLTLDALSFIVSALTLWAIRRPESGSTPMIAPERVRVDMRDGLLILWRHPMLRHVALIDGVNNIFFGLSASVYMLYISRGLHLGPVLQGVLYAVGGVASLATAGHTNRLVARLGYGRTLVFGSLLAASGTAFLPLAFGPVWALCAFIVGQQVLGDSGDTLLLVGLSSLRQVHTANAVLGRVRATWLVLTSLGMLIGIIAGGELAEIIGLKDTLFVGVGIRLGVVLLAMLGGPAIAQAGKDPQITNPASSNPPLT